METIQNYLYFTPFPLQAMLWRWCQRHFQLSLSYLRHKQHCLEGEGRKWGGRSSFKIFFIIALVFAIRWLPNSFGRFCWISLGTMHQTIYCHYVEVGENSSLTIFVNNWRELRIFQGAMDFNRIKIFFMTV